MTETPLSTLDAQLAALSGAPFTKMTGSGNDFVVFDAREVDRGLVEVPEVIRAICNRHNGIGADGVVVLEPSEWSESPKATNEPGGERPDAGRETVAPILLRYFNSDGSLGELCGNATLCSTTLAVRSGLARADRVLLDTDSGRVSARLTDDGEPQIDLAPVSIVHPEQPLLERLAGETRAGFALVGVPHVVLVTTKLDDVAVDERGRSIRQHPSLRPDGANVNWVAPAGDGRWAYRTYERGVEGETLACGTGAVAAAILLTSWGLASSPVRLVTRSGRELCVSLGVAAAPDASEACWTASLRGEGRVVFRGEIGRLG